MYLLNEIKHNVHMHYAMQLIILRWNKINYMLEIDILRNSSQNHLGVLKGDFWGFGCSKSTQMSCWLRLYMPWDTYMFCFQAVEEMPSLWSVPIWMYAASWGRMAGRSRPSRNPGIYSPTTTARDPARSCPITIPSAVPTASNTATHSGWTIHWTKAKSPSWKEVGKI